MHDTPLIGMKAPAKLHPKSLETLGTGQQMISCLIMRPTGRQSPLEGGRRRSHKIAFNHQEPPTTHRQRTCHFPDP